MVRVERRERVIGAVALGVAALLAVVVVVGVIRALGSGNWVVASSASVLMAAAVSQWAAVRARGRGGRLVMGEFALLVALGVLGLVLCGFDFVTGDRGDRSFTVLLAAGLIVVVGGVIGFYWRSLDRGTAAGRSGT
jgi:drug/metabolite transporter (DMT)-like permease